MNPDYSNDPQRISQYYMNTTVLVSESNRLQNLDPFVTQLVPPASKKQDVDIMQIKARDTVPEQFESIGTQIGKSCNLPGLSIDRFENPNEHIQDPIYIIANEPFRGGIPSRIVMKDNYVNSLQQK